MKKLIALTLLLVVAPLFGLVATPASVYGMTGSGTSGDPYMIYNATDLQDMDLVLTAYYELANDIDCINTTTWNGGAGFDPIGNAGIDTVKFRGHFDGNGYTISNLWINRYGENEVGLFGYTLNAEITNVNFHNCTIKGGGIHVGTVIGIGGNDVSYITVTEGDVYGGDRIGGFVGYPNGNYEYCSFSGNVTNNSDSHIGGFAGYINSGTIYRCWSNANVLALATSNRPFYIGGFIGEMNGATGSPVIRECFAYGYVQANNYGTYVPYPVGGFVGRMYQGSTTIYDCGSLADVYTAEGIRVGGFIGRAEYDDCDIYRSYCAGSVYGASSVGGFCGLDDAGSGSTFSTCFWDIETTGWPTSAGDAIGRNTTDMKTEANYTDFGWDFDTIWGMIPIMNVGYPSLLFTYAPSQLVWFQPNAIIEGTTLPNRAANATIDGEIHWGSVPAGVEIEHGIWTPESDYEFAPITAEGPDIIQPDPSSLVTDVDTAGLVNNPLYPMVATLGALPGLNERLVWLGLAWLAVIAAMLFVHIGFDTKKDTEKPHHFVLTTIVGLGLSILFYTMGIFPLWVVIVLAFGFIGAIVYERQPVL